VIADAEQRFTAVRSMHIACAKDVREPEVNGYSSPGTP
jgi:hypothetical protein